jgi:hypothetical protein
MNPPTVRTRPMLVPEYPWLARYRGNTTVRKAVEKLRTALLA